MTKNTATSTSALLANEVGYDPIEDRLRQNLTAPQAERRKSMGRGRRLLCFWGSLFANGRFLLFGLSLDASCDYPAVHTHASG